MLQLTDQICCCLSSPVLLLHVQPTNNIFLVQNSYKAKQTKLTSVPLQEETAFGIFRFWEGTFMLHMCLEGLSPVFICKS